MLNNNRQQSFCKALIYALFMILFSANSTAQTSGNVVQFADITISPAPPMQGQSIHGYVEFRFLVSNSGNNSHKVTLNFPHPSSSYSKSQHYIAGISKTVEVAAKSSAIISLFQPALQLGGDQVQVIIDGNRQEAALACNSNHPTDYYPYSSDNPILILLSRECQGEFFVRDRYATGYGSAKPIPKPSGKFEFPQGFKFQRSVSSVSSWSEQWLGYSRYDAIVITAKEMDRLTAKACDALASYVQCGGLLIILGIWDIPDYWHTRDKRTLEKKLFSYPVGFGRCIISERKKINDLSYDQLDSLKTLINEINETWRGIATISASKANSRFQIADDVGVPMRGMFLLLLVFTIVIGPVNFIVLKRKNKRIWFLVTVPLISMVACLIIFSYSALATGWKKYARSETVTILDENNQRATTIGWAGYYSTTTPGKGLCFSATTELTALIDDGRVATARYIDWSSGQQLTSGWIAARVPSHYILRKSEMRRERVTVKRQANGELVAINGLGMTIQELNVADANGEIHQARNIAPGQRVSLQATGHSCMAMPKSLYQMFIALPNASLVDLLAHAPSQYLIPGSYMAVLNDAPFIEKGLDVDTRNDRCAIFAYMKGIEDES